MKCIFDIETLSLGSIKTTGIGNTPIIAIGLYLIENDEEKIFTINTYIEKYRGYRDPLDLAEAELIYEMIVQLRKWNVETLIGYNIFNFDLPYLALRTRKLSFRFEREKGINLKKEYTILFGKIQEIIDLYSIILEKEKRNAISLREAYNILTGETTGETNTYDIYVVGAVELILNKPEKIKEHLSNDLKMTLKIYRQLQI